MTIRRFEDIESWRMARQLSKEIYALSGSGRFCRDLGLKDQIRKAAGSIMHNIAEGFDSGSNVDFARFLRYAQRSATEVHSELYVALDQGYLTEEQFVALAEIIRVIKSRIGGLIVYLRKCHPR
ncbi:MAG: four helix bundle protein [Verrucomicrobiales bacterium]